MHSGQMRQSEEEVVGSLGGFRAQPTRLAIVPGNSCHRLLAFALAPERGYMAGGLRGAEGVRADRSCGAYLM
jgi:hypothetical protein